MNDRRQDQSQDRDQSQGQGRQDQGGSQGQDESKRWRDPSAIEWLVGGISTVLVLCGIGFLVYQAWSGTSLPPMVSARVDRVLEAPGGYVVEITAANIGGTTAQGVTIEGELREREPTSPGFQQGNGNRQSSAGGAVQQAGNRRGGGSVVEKSSTTIQWVPAHAERQGGLFFSRNPLEYELILRPQGYERP